MKRCGCLLLLLIACGTAYCQPGWTHRQPKSYPGDSFTFTVSGSTENAMAIMRKMTRLDGSACQSTDLMDMHYMCVPAPEPADVPAIQVIDQMCIEVLSTGECKNSLYDTRFICTDRQRFLLQR